MTKVRFKFLYVAVNLLLTVTISESLKLTDSKDPAVTFESDPEQGYSVHINENIANVILFNIEEAKGTPIASEKVGKCGRFRYEIIEKDAIFAFNLTSSLDYEQNGCQTVTLLVEDRSENAYIDVHVNNLDDNPPELSIKDDSRCLFQENTPYTIHNTTCILEMTDADGMMETATFTITPNTYVDTFAVSYLNLPKHEDKNAEVHIYLLDGQELDYETINKYIFTVKVQETLTDNAITVPLDVKDMPDQPPQWTTIFSTKQFEENVDQTFQVKAIDGDFGINNQIYYKITNNVCERDEHTCKITIDEHSGVIDVKSVDREDVGNTISFVLEAIEYNPTNTTKQDIYFFIEDQDDLYPEFEDESVLKKEIKENFVGSITDFKVTDMDLANNGTYDITMKSSSDSIDYTEPFQVIPTQGYQEGQFTLYSISATKLDYEDPEWQNITFELVSTELFNSSHSRTRKVQIILQNYNDEFPIFVDKSDTVSIWENITKGKTIFNASATDKDAGDIVSYLIIGIWAEKLDISTSGIISPKYDNVFDYEQLEQVVIQIRASDKVEHLTYKTLTINVGDIDDEPPSIKVGNKRVQIKENGTVHEQILDAEITGSDPDTKPKLKLEIDWSKSYVTKNSVEQTYDNDKWKCFDLITHEKDIRHITGILETSETCRPDFELYDTISISLIITDENTQEKSPTATGSIQISIQDINDNPPEFLPFKEMKVTDDTNGDTADIIGTITANDPDISDNVTYSINYSPEHPECDWIEINPNNGELSIKKGVTINDDIPPRDSIPVTVTASDGVHEDVKTLTILMTDVNNQPPKILNKITETHVLEKTESGPVISLNGKDLDRDVPFHTMVFRFDNNITNEASNCFAISDDGQITVELKNGAKLDRDKGQTSYILPVLLYDNPKGTVQWKDHLDLKVILDDINDHAPEILNKTIECSENMKKAGTLGPIIAEDIDEEGDNSKAKFEITNIEPISYSGGKVLSKNDLKISSNDYKTATLEFQRDLREYFGIYNLTVHTSDYGKEPQTKNNFITLTVTKFNFERPKFVFPPTTGTTLILSDDQTYASDACSEPLKMFNQENLQDLEVNDQQNHKWKVTFGITEEKGTKSKLFSIKSCGSWKAQLGLLRALAEDDKNTLHTITIDASVNTEKLPDEAPTTVSTELNIKFVSENEEPEYETNKCETIYFDEDAPDEHSADPPQPTGKATYPSGIDLPVYYTLLDHTDVFKVNPSTGYLSVQRELHYKDTPSFDLKIAASKKKSGPIDPSEKSVLNVPIKVYALNINKPVFHPSKFNGAFLKSFNKDSTIVTVYATDEDVIDVDKLRYSLYEMSCTPSVQAPTEPFGIGDVDGKITPKFVLTSAMSGYCNMKVSVKDGEDKYKKQHTVETTVQISIISTDELVQFTFLNDDSYISERQEEITAAIDEIFKKYNYKSYLADLIYDEEWRNTTGDFYFLNAETKIPVEAKEILGNFTDFDKFTTLKKALGDIGVNLGNFPSAYPTDVEDYMKIWLIATTIVLASFLVLLSVAFFFRNRALTQRISNLSTTKFGSQESDLNRAGLAAPTTNRNAVEGSNPVFHSEKFHSEIEPDTRSIISSDSDLFGIENNDQFDI